MSKTLRSEGVLNRLAGAPSTGLGYDALGRLQVVSKNGSTTQFMYDGDQLIAEFDGNFNLLRWYVDA